MTRTHDQWVQLFIQDVVQALAPFTGRKVCRHLVSEVEEKLDLLLTHNMTSLITVRCTKWYEVRIPGSFELVGRVNPWKVAVTPEGVRVPWEGTAPSYPADEVRS